MTESKWKRECREKRKFWSSHINSWKDTSLSQSEYCRQHNLKHTRFTYWKRRLEKLKTPVSFYPVPLEKIKMTSAPDTPHHLRLILGEKYHLDIGDNFNPGTLKRVIQTLKEL
jgi:hypothetical protein